MPAGFVLGRRLLAAYPKGHASVASVPAALHGGRRVSARLARLADSSTRAESAKRARLGWAGEISGHFEHPAAIQIVTERRIP
jgi:hypothetical protein